MLWATVIVLAFLWALGSVTSVMLGGFIHVPIVIAAVLLLFRLLKTPHVKGLPGPSSW